MRWGCLVRRAPEAVLPRPLAASPRGRRQADGPPDLGRGRQGSHPRRSRGRPTGGCRSPLWGRERPKIGLGDAVFRVTESAWMPAFGLADDILCPSAAIDTRRPALSNSSRRRFTAARRSGLPLNTTANRPVGVAPGPRPANRRRIPLRGLSARPGARRRDARRGRTQN